MADASELESSAGPDRWSPSVRALRIIAAAAVASGVVVLVVTVARVVGDSTNGAVLRSDSGVLAVAAVALLAAVVGVTVLFVVSKLPARAGRLRVVLGLCTLVLVVAAPLALVSWYPAARPARLVARDAETGSVRWRTRLPATQLFSIKEFGSELLLYGVADERCNYRFVTIRLDAATGKVLGATENNLTPQGPYVPPSLSDNDPLVAGIHLDAGGARVVSSSGWSVEVSPDVGPIPALVTNGFVYLAEQGENHLSCNS